MNYRFAFQIDLFLEQLQASRKAEATIQSYRRRLLYFTNWLKKDDVRSVDAVIVMDYKKHIVSQEKYSTDWKLRSLSFLRKFYRWLSLENIILADPTAKLELPRGTGRKLPHYLLQTEVAGLLEAADPETPSGLRDRAILETIYSTGMRASECYRLQLAEIDFGDGIVSIVCGKGRKDRIVPIGDVALHFIDRYIKEARPPGPGHLFRKIQSHQPIDAHDLRTILIRYSKRAGLKINVNPHLLRHSFAVHLLENGAGIRHIQQLLGHENLNATQIYTRVVPLQLKKVHARSHPAEKRKEETSPIRIENYYRKKG